MRKKKEDEAAGRIAETIRVSRNEGKTPADSAEKVISHSKVKRNRIKKAETAVTPLFVSKQRSRAIKKSKL